VLYHCYATIPVLLEIKTNQNQIQPFVKDGDNIPRFTQKTIPTYDRRLLVNLKPRRHYLNTETVYDKRIGSENRDVTKQRKEIIPAPKAKKNTATQAVV